MTPQSVTNPKSSVPYTVYTVCSTVYTASGHNRFFSIQPKIIDASVYEDKLLHIAPVC